MNQPQKIHEKHDNDFALFIEAGFVAVNQLDEVSATSCFNAAATLRPHSTAPKLGLGFIALNKMDHGTAQNYFKDVLDQDPDHDLARVFLGIALAFQDDTRHQGRQMIEDMLSKSNDEHVVHLAKTSLEWIQKDFGVKV